MFLLNVEATKVGAEFLINDVPVLLLKEQPANADAAFVSVRITGGKNVLRCVVRPGTSPAQSLVPFQSDLPVGKIAATILRLPPNFKAGPPAGQTVAQIAWPAPEDVTSGRWPVIKEVSFDAPAPAFNATWRRADPLILDRETVASALDWLNQLRGWFEAGNADAVIAAASDSLRDEAIAYGKDPASHVSSFAQMVRGQGKVLDLAPIDAAALQLRLFGDGRLIDCRRADWSPAIRTLPQAKEPFDYPTLIGRVDGHWKLL